MLTDQQSWKLPKTCHIAMPCLTDTRTTNQRPLPVERAGAAFIVNVLNEQKMKVTAYTRCDDNPHVLNSVRKEQVKHKQSGQGNKAQPLAATKVRRQNNYQGISCINPDIKRARTKAKQEQSSLDHCVILELLFIRSKLSSQKTS